MERVTHILEEIKRGIGAIKNLLEKEEVFMVLIIILVGFGGFGLGRLSKISEEKSPVRVFKESALLGTSGDGNPAQSQTSSEKQFVASIAGAKYHLPWCAGASSIKEENKIWFATKEE